MLLKSALNVFVARPRIHSLKSPRMIFGPVDSMVVDEGGQPRRLVSPLQHCRPEVDVVDVHQPAVAQIEIGALAGALLARAPGQIVLRVVHDREAAHDHVAEEMPPKMPHRRHHPAHAERRADLLRLTGPRRPRADDFLQRDDVGVDVAKHFRDPRRRDAAVHAPRSMDVVGGDPQIDVPAAAAGIARRAAHCCRSRIQMNGPTMLFPHRSRAARLRSVISSLSSTSRR